MPHLASIAVLLSFHRRNSDPATVFRNLGEGCCAEKMAIAKYENTTVSAFRPCGALTFRILEEQ